MTTPAPEELSAFLRETIEFFLRAGTLTEPQIEEHIGVIIEAELGRPDPSLWQTLSPLVQEGVRAQLERERSWTARTGNDALDDALFELAERGIIGLQATGSTVQEGWAIAEAVAAEVASDARGAVFYHLQDLERGVAGGRLMLAFGAFDRAELAAHATRSPPATDEPARLKIQNVSQNAEGHGHAQRDATRVVGEEAVAVLRRHGLEPSWDGSPLTRIQLAPFPWQKRAQTAAPARTEALPELALPTEAAPEPVCPDCEGRGWLPPLVPGDFSDFCWCKGGKRPRPAAAATKKTPEVPATTASPPHATPGPAAAGETPEVPETVAAPPEVASPPIAPTEPGPTAPPTGILARLRKWLGGGD